MSDWDFGGADAEYGECDDLETWERDQLAIDNEGEDDECDYDGLTDCEVDDG